MVIEEGGSFSQKHRGYSHFESGKYFGDSREKFDIVSTANYI